MVSITLMIDLLVVSFLQLFSTVSSSAVLIGDGCDNTHLNPGDSVLLYCFLNNTGLSGLNQLVWISPVTISLLVSSDSVVSMGYTVAVVGGSDTENTVNSSISFIATTQHDNTVVTCQDVLNPPNKATCIILVYSKLYMLLILITYHFGFYYTQLLLVHQLT